MVVQTKSKTSLVYPVVYSSSVLTQAYSTAACSLVRSRKASLCALGWPAREPESGPPWMCMPRTPVQQYHSSITHHTGLACLFRIDQDARCNQYLEPDSGWSGLLCTKAGNHDKPQREFFFFVFSNDCSTLFSRLSPLY